MSLRQILLQHQRYIIKVQIIILLCVILTSVSADDKPKYIQYEIGT